MCVILILAIASTLAACGGGQSSQVVTHEAGQTVITTKTAGLFGVQTCETRITVGGSLFTNCD